MGWGAGCMICSGRGVILTVVDDWVGERDDGGMRESAR